ncbi:hypothetical protein [Thermoleptolyngbya sp. C42_A2020_037]|uniref:hypothetical protein n=1 Tax=Thermoleptolyngbya sp. C42_A2020_037 TaxID=2747799 RepID=UPI0019DD26F2|nr:hypothetical protein [Thermoleptolyngbya sp. C42_A2020_037]MBF2086288.1 hypothetical protein [Thermoleptolyngbya sp. C42_A2020_037]
MKIEALDYYAKKFQRLRVDRAHGVAPHKPILLLSVIEHIQRGTIENNQIYLKAELTETFLKYWSYLGSLNHRPDISRPFFHMRSGKFWHFWANSGYEHLISSGVKLKTFAEVKRAIRYAYLDEDLFEFLCQPDIRSSLTAVLISRWFPGQHALIEEISQTDRFREPPAYIPEDFSNFYSPQ